MRGLPAPGWLVITLVTLFPESKGLPSLHETPVDPVFVNSGDEALIECVAKYTDNYTLIWQRFTQSLMSSEILTAGLVRVTSDKRISILHEKDSDIWVLRINPVNENDAGRYICEVNSVPRLHVFRVLAVRASNKSSHFLPAATDNTGCCMQAGIPVGCLDFCNLGNVLRKVHPNPWSCMDHLPVITKCLTDGRNHMPCCRRQNIPEVCRSVCVGDYTLSTVIQHYSCMNYTIPTLACISEGVELLPGPAQDLRVEPVSSTSLRVSWMPPIQPIPVTHYVINITKLHSIGNSEKEEKSDSRKGKDISLKKSSFETKVNGNNTLHVFQDLEPQTVYEVKMTSVNMHGESLPTYSIRMLTLADGEKILGPSKTIMDVTLPDIRGCCEKKGVQMGRCLENMCDPTKADRIRLTDVMICAPWANVTFECMAGRVDHSQCCKEREVPDVCLDFCKGTITRVDYRHFICLEHMEAYGNCLLEHYGVISSPPQDYAVKIIHSEWVVLHWKPPKYLPETVTGYTIHWRAVEDVDSEFRAVSGVRSPFVLDGLLPGTQYESYVVASSQFGSSKHSTSVVFTTTPVIKSEDGDNANRWYNETACCASAGLRPECMPLCSYDVKLTDMYELGPVCVHQLDILLRCAAGGRDHTPCCKHRGVSWECWPICSGSLTPSQLGLGTTCTAELGKVLQCMVEGMDILPGIPVDFHATTITPTSVALKWNPSPDGANSTMYQIRYNLVINGIPPHPYNYIRNTTVINSTTATIQDLLPGSLHSFYVVAGNKHGFSQPSLILIINTTRSEENVTGIYGTLGPAHSLELLEETASSIALRWLSPLHLAPEAPIEYTIYYQMANQKGAIQDSKFKFVTTFTSAEIYNLTSNTQYAIAVRAKSGKSISRLSELLLAWTESPTPAFVNPPLIVPAGPIVEGSNVTIMCIAMGTPAPTVSLYVNGEVKVEKVQHHVAFTIQSIRYNVTSTACFADNGHGQGAYSSTEIHVSVAPSVEAITPVIKAVIGGTAKLQCKISGFPEPRILWYKGSTKNFPVQRQSNIALELSPDLKERAKYVATLIFMDLSQSDTGEYMCTAENPLGSSASSIKLEIGNTSYGNTSVCCREQKVSSQCLDACAYDVDMQLALDRPACIKDLDKLMYCAADGRDHRKCCRDKGVPRKCRKWCMGHPVTNAPLCALAAAKEIVNCFEEGKSILPGPPMNVHISQTTGNGVEVHWEPPQKNPEAVQYYKVFWRPVGSRALFRNQTYNPYMHLDGLEPGKTYEVAIKSGNHYGLSVHTDPIVITVSGPGIRSAELLAEPSTAVKASIAVVAIVIIAVLAILSVLFYLRRRRLQKQEAGVSFENPAYLKEGSNAQSSAPGEDNCVRLGTKGNGDSGHKMNGTRVAIS